TNGVLHLTDAATNQALSGSFTVDDFGHGVLIEDFRATFNLRISAPSTSPFGDDRFEFDFGTLSVKFWLGSTFFSIPANISAVNASRSSDQIPVTLVTSNTFVPVEIVLHRGGLLDVSYNGVKVLSNFDTGYTPRFGQFSLVGSVGGGSSIS